MAKLKQLDTKLIKPEFFVNKRSYEAALYAVEVCNKIIRRHNSGDIVFEYENLIKPEFELRFNKAGIFEGLFLKDGEGCWVWIVGDVRQDGTPIIGEYKTIIGYEPGLIECTKREIREYFKLWRVAKIANVSKVTDLTR